MMYDTLFFDLDNTLLDFTRAEAAAIKQVLKKHGLADDDFTADIYSRINNIYWERFERGLIPKNEIYEGRFRTLLSVLGGNVSAARLSEDYFYALSEQHFEVEGAEDILKYLKEKGYFICITTNGCALTQKKRIEHCGIKKYFDRVFVSEDVGFQKPQREYFDTVTDKIGLDDRSRILIIGDSQSSDILGGINAGIDTCWFDFSGKTAEYESKYVIKTLDELKEIL